MSKGFCNESVFSIDLQVKLDELWKILDEKSQEGLIERTVLKNFLDPEKGNFLELKKEDFKLKDLFEKLETKYEISNKDKNLIKWLFYCFVAYNYDFSLDVYRRTKNVQNIEKHRDKIKDFLKESLSSFYFLNFAPNTILKHPFFKEEVSSIEWESIYKEMFSEVGKENFKRFKFISDICIDTQKVPEIEISGEVFAPEEDIFINHRLVGKVIQCDIKISGFEYLTRTVEIDLSGFEEKNTFYIRLFDRKSDKNFYLFLDISSSLEKEDIHYVLEELGRLLGPLDFIGKVTYFGSKLYDIDSNKISLTEDGFKEVIKRYDYHKEKYKEDEITDIVNIFQELPEVINKEEKPILVIISDGIHEENLNIQRNLKIDFKRTFLNQFEKIIPHFKNMQESLDKNWVTPYVFLIPSKIYLGFDMSTVEKCWNSLFDDWCGYPLTFGIKELNKDWICDKPAILLKDLACLYPINIWPLKDNYDYKWIQLSFQNRSPDRIDLYIKFFSKGGNYIQTFPSNIENFKLKKPDLSEEEVDWIPILIPPSTKRYIFNFFLKTRIDLNDINFAYKFEDVTFRIIKNFKSKTYFYNDIINMENKVKIHSPKIRDLKIDIEDPKKEGNIVTSLIEKNKKIKKNYIEYPIPLRLDRDIPLENIPVDIKIDKEDKALTFRVIIDELEMLGLKWLRVLEITRNYLLILLVFSALVVIFLKNLKMKKVVFYVSPILLTIISVSFVLNKRVPLHSHLLFASLLLILFLVIASNLLLYEKNIFYFRSINSDTISEWRSYKLLQWLFLGLLIVSFLLFFLFIIYPSPNPLIYSLIVSVLPVVLLVIQIILGSRNPLRIN